MYCVRTGRRSAIAVAVSLAALLLGTWMLIALSAENPPDPGRYPPAVLLLATLVTTLGGASVLVVAGGQFIVGRPLLILTDEGVTLPAQWPRSRHHDKTATWDEIATIRAYTQTIRTAATIRNHFLTFVPTSDAAERIKTSGWETIEAGLVPTSAHEHRFSVLLQSIPEHTVNEIVLQAQKRCPRLSFQDDRSYGFLHPR